MGRRSKSSRSVGQLARVALMESVNPLFASDRVPVCRATQSGRRQNSFGLISLTRTTHFACSCLRLPMQWRTTNRMSDPTSSGQMKVNHCTRSCQRFFSPDRRDAGWISAQKLTTRIDLNPPPRCVPHQAQCVAPILRDVSADLRHSVAPPKEICMHARYGKTFHLPLSSQPNTECCVACLNGGL